LGLLYWANNGLIARQFRLPQSGGGLWRRDRRAAGLGLHAGGADGHRMVAVQLQAGPEKPGRARDHRGQLAHVVKELDSANIRLERLNRMLVLARAEAEDAKEARNRFALAISHELRTPLNFIISFSEIMVKTPLTYAPLTRWPAGLYDDIQEIYRSSKHLMRLVNDVLDLGQIENMRMNLIKEWISLAQIVSEAGMIQRAFDLKNMDLNIEIEPDLPLVFVDRTRIRQVLLNLVNNSLRFTDQGSVTLRLHAARRTNTLLVLRGRYRHRHCARKISRASLKSFQQVSKDSWRRREGDRAGHPDQQAVYRAARRADVGGKRAGQRHPFLLYHPVNYQRFNPGGLDKDREDRYWQALKDRAEKASTSCFLQRPGGR
jgi:signal transduction histidine kinase